MRKLIFSTILLSFLARADIAYETSFRLDGPIVAFDGDEAWMVGNIVLEKKEILAIQKKSTDPKIKALCEIALTIAHYEHLKAEKEMKK